MTDDSKDWEELGERLQEERKYRGYSQKEIADFLGISRSSISLIEGGDRKINSIELQKLADFYGTTVDSLLDSSPGSGQNDEIDLIARKAEDLSSEDRKEVLRFAEFFISQKTGEEENGQSR